MASKYQRISALSEQAAKDVTGSSLRWMDYLDTASRLYRYPFHEQLLIHAQRPDATACASLELWNNRMGRWVNRGAKGIALLDDSGEWPRLKYVFDISDTHRGIDGKDPYLWQLREEDQTALMDYLKSAYPIDQSISDLSDCLRQVAMDSVNDGLPDYMRNLSYAVEGSFLEGLDERNLEVRFRELMTDSMHYILLERCGLNGRETLEAEDFQTITEFNSPMALAQIGNAVSESVQPILRDIGIQIHQMEQERISQEQKKTLANEHDSGYNRFTTLNQETKGEESHDEDGIHEQGGIPDPQRGTGRATETGNGPLRQDAEELPERESQRTVSGAADERQVEQSPHGDRPDRQREDGTVANGDGESRGSDRGAESEQSDAVVGSDEQHPEPGRGDRAERTGLRLTAEPKDTWLSSSSVSEVNSLHIFDEVLKMGSNRSGSVLRIAAHFMLEAGDDAEFLKQEFRQGGKGIVVDGTDCAAWFTDAGISVAAGYRAEAVAHSDTFSWQLAAERIQYLLSVGQYAPQVILQQALPNERSELATSLWYLHQDCNADFFMEKALFQGGFPESTERIAERLQDRDFVSDTVQGLGEFVMRYEEDRSILRYNFHKPEEILKRLSSLENPQIHLPLSQVDTFRSHVDFVTEDEVDHFFMSGGPYSDHRLSAYAYFIQNHTDKEKADFLKEAYGIGGRSHALCGADDSYAGYDGKSLILDRGKRSDGEPIQVKMSWAKVSKRVETLILQGRYLQREDYQQMPRYERHVIAQRISSFYYNRDKTALNLSDAADLFFDLQAIEKQLPDGRWLETVVQDMSEIVGQMEETDVQYERAQNLFADVVAYQKGTFSLFLPCREMQAKAQSYGTELFTSSRNEEPDDLVPVYEYRVGDSVYLGQSEYEVDQIESGSIVLRDKQLPLFVYSYEKEQLDSLVSEHPQNIHLIVGMVKREPVQEQEQEVTVETEEQQEEPTNELAREPLEEQSEIPEPTVPDSKQEPANFQITDMDLGAGGPKAKFHRNMDAIHLLQKLEREGRMATSEEQQVLSQYVGWGGIPWAFDPNNEDWAKEYQELKDTLTDSEFTAARASTLNAHYTSPTVIRAIYDALGQMGFQNGNILEPSMGVGNFFGMLPETMQDSRLYGVELDSITGRIAKQLYQKANITVDGFEKTSYPNDFFDVVVGNVPFGNYSVVDKKYDRLHFQIHDYFLAKSIDQVRPGGVVAVITSAGTLDKQNSAAREYLAERAELLGAIRLPNNAFRRNAGTDVVSDILFLQKRETPSLDRPEWTQLGKSAEGYTINQYFVRHPEMVLGTLTEESTQYGKLECTVKPIEGADLAEQLQEAVSHIHGTIEVAQVQDTDLEEETVSIPADPNVKNYSYTVVDGAVYYRENSVMNRADLPTVTAERVKGMVAIRDCAQQLIDCQLNDGSEEEIAQHQFQLNALYDSFSKKYGLLSSSANKRAFQQDNSYCLLCSLEVLDEEGNLERKADMFTKRTIKKAEVVSHVDTASEALAVSMGERAKVDIPYMMELSGKSEAELVEELRGVIFLNPLNDQWETADAYLSGNVRSKMEVAKTFAENDPRHAVNVGFLEQVQPKDLEAAEIEVRLGATWIKPEYIRDFMADLFQTPRSLLGNVIDVRYSPASGEWNISGKNRDSYSNVLARMTYGTERVNGYRLLEDALNLRDTRVYDTVREDGAEKRVLNKKETMLAQQKQDAIKTAFQEWIFKDPTRRAELVQEYNMRFNSNRPREFNGEHLRFQGMNPAIELRPHQKNAVAHVLYGGNTLLAHCVGGGKTFEMIAAAMETKRLGLCQKSLFVVPNHLTEQWGSDFLKLYPGANILVATKKDFEPDNRKKFCARIATGDYDAVIIGHTQFERIPLSLVRQVRMLEDQINELMFQIEEAEDSNAERYTIKQLEKTRKSLEARLARLNDQSKKDDVVTFEQLGVDRLFVDESHGYKNLFLYTKMRNIAGIAQTEAQKSSDMFAKCRYIDEITGGKGITFATGTPISNSMTELYTLMRYLQYDTLMEMNLGHFDSWASTFGETVTAVELAPEGTGYRAKTRFARFFNLPELMSIFKETADIQTADMLNLPVPQAIYTDVVLEPSEEQQAMVEALGERAEIVRGGGIDSSEDNMLKITNDGRKLALDQRLNNPLLPDDPNSKTNACVSNVFQIWQDTTAERSAQLVFCDLSTPKGDGAYNVYDDLRTKLMEKGVPPEEIAFIHEANTEVKKAELFGKVRSGQVRVLIGSTAKMGPGMNVQDRLIALHHLDVPWKPSDIEQQEGRIIRQGNRNEQVHIFRYITKGTFDAYSWQLLENKQKFISQIMTSKSPVRSADDIDEASLSYAEIKALATGNPYIKEKMDLDIQVAKLRLLKSNFDSQRYRLEDDILVNFPKMIAATEERLSGLRADQITAGEHLPKDADTFTMEIAGKVYDSKKEAGLAIIAACSGLKAIQKEGEIGHYAGFSMSVRFDAFRNQFELTLRGKSSYTVEIGTDGLGNITRINHALENIPGQIAKATERLAMLHGQLETAKIEIERPFAQDGELKAMEARLSELNALLNMDAGQDSPEAELEDDGEEEPEIADKPVGKISVMDRLRRMQDKVKSTTQVQEQKHQNQER